MVEGGLGELVAEGSIPPFVYTYPPRSAHRASDDDRTLADIWGADYDVSATRDLNLYIHVPFCGYKCGFCNLYTIATHGEDLRQAYVRAIQRQLTDLRDEIRRRRIVTVYIGGGTPSMLEVGQIGAVLETLDEVVPGWRRSVEEVCIEATPDSLVEQPGRVEGLIGLGVTRVNMGVQSLSNAELKRAGRSRADRETVLAAVRLVRAAGLPNLSVDLIMGFDNQTDESFASSVRDLIELRPETVSTYFLTVRPDAWFARTGRYSYARNPSLYDRYDYARERLLSAGYVQESNVRYKIAGRGGYRQKVLQFRGVPVLGLGAGARGYTSSVDYTIGLDHSPSRDEVQRYVDSVLSGEPLPLRTFVFDDEERIRKRLALDSFDLDMGELRQWGALDRLRHVWEPTVAEAERLGLLRRLTPTRMQLTPAGFKYRDILSWQFFSSRVIELDRSFYEGVHNGDPRVQVGIRKSLELSVLRPISGSS